MMDFFKEALKVRSVFGVAIVCLALVFAFKDEILQISPLRDLAALNLILAFLFLTLLGILGTSAFYSLSSKEIEKEVNEVNKGTIDVTNSKRVEGEANHGGRIKVDQSEDVKVKTTNNPTSEEKKTK